MQLVDSFFLHADPTTFLVALLDSEPSHHNEVYVKFGAAPTREDYHYRFTAPATANQQVLVPNAAHGAWYILVYTDHAAVPSAFTLTARSSTVALTRVTPDKHGTNEDTRMRLFGAGFDASATVTLIAQNGARFAAGSVEFDSTFQLTAIIDANSVPAGLYSVEVRLSTGSLATLTDAFRVTPGGQAKLVAGACWTVLAI